MMNLQQSLSEDIRCEIPNHFLDKVLYVCVFEGCTADQRLCCSYCKFRFHNQHIQSLVKISDFTNKVQKDGLMLNIQLQEKGKNNQLDQLYWQKIDKKIKDEIHYANMQLQGVFSNINAEVSGQIHQMNHQIDEKALGQSVFDLQTKVQRIISRPWSHQSNQAIDLMAKIYRGDKQGELLEDEYFISHRNLQSINNYFSSVHIKLEAFFKNIIEQIPLIFKESFANTNNSQNEIFNIKRKEKDQTYPSIRTSSVRREQKDADGQNLSYNIYDQNSKNSHKSLMMSNDNNKSRQELDSQLNTYDLERQRNLDQSSYNSYQQSRAARSVSNIMNNGQNSKPQSTLFRQYDQSQDRKVKNNFDSLDQYTLQMQNGNHQNASSSQGYYPFGQQDMFNDSQDPYIRYSKQLQQRRGNSQHHSNEVWNSTQNQRQNNHLNPNQYGHGEYQGQSAPKSLNQIDDIQENSFQNQYQNSSPDRSEKRINNNGNDDSLNYIQFDNPSKTKSERNQGYQMSLILPSDASRDYVPQGSKIYLPSETQLDKQQSHLKQPPQQKNFDHCKLPIQSAPYDLIQKPIENDQQKIKNNQPQKDWVAQTSYPENFALKNKLKDIQIKYGFIKIPDKNEGQSRLGLMKSAKGDNYYEGEWLKGKRHGKGTFYDQEGFIYEGEWRDDQMTGKGRLVTKDELYEGDLLNGIIHGKGFLRYPNGQDYIGDFKQGKLEGEGRKNWNNGAYYEGQFLNNQRVGQGVFMWKNGSFYQGNFKNNQFNGNGYYQWQSGRLYEGEWVDGKMEGKGRDISDQGYVYEGQFKNDQKNGYGVYVVSENKIYKGNWQDDKPHGEGVMIEKGIEKKGFWENGVKKN